MMLHPPQPLALAFPTQTHICYLLCDWDLEFITALLSLPFLQIYDGTLKVLGIWLTLLIRRFQNLLEPHEHKDYWHIRLHSMKQSVRMCGKEGGTRWTRT